VDTWSPAGPAHLVGLATQRADPLVGQKMQHRFHGIHLVLTKSN